MAAGERKKKLGSGLLEDARSKITDRNRRLREAAGDEPHEEGSRRQNKRKAVK